jgi:aryl-alcohol dehydrogenase-like predicted oxidoreductase
VSTAGVGGQRRHVADIRAMSGRITLAQRLFDLAERVGVPAAQLALGWVLAKGDHIVPIPGTRRQHNLAANLEAARPPLAPELMAELDRFFHWAWPLALVTTPQSPAPRDS